MAVICARNAFHRTNKRDIWSGTLNMNVECRLNSNVKYVAENLSTKAISKLITFLYIKMCKLS